MKKNIPKILEEISYPEFIQPSLSDEQLVKAKLLLMNMETKEVAQELEKKATDFIVAFRKKTGFTPREYRKQKNYNETY